MSYGYTYCSFRFFQDKDGVRRCRLHPELRLIDNWYCEGCYEIDENIQITDFLASPGFSFRSERPSIPHKDRRHKVLKCHARQQEEKKEIEMWRTRPYRKAELKRKKDK